MLKSPIRILLLTVALVFAVEPLQSVHGIILSQVELATLNTPDTPVVSSREKQQSKGNGFLRALKAPFRAIGRLFRRGKNDENKLQRISQKDIKKFESAPANRIDNSAPVAVSPGEKSTSSTETSATDHLQKGRALLNSGNLNGAIAELSIAASLDPKLSEAHTLLGVAYDRKGLNDRARQSFEVALDDPNDQAMHLNNLGYLQYERGEYKEAIKYLKRAARLAPNDQRIWNNLGLAQAELGKFDDAYKSFARVAGEFNGRLNVAARLESQGSTDKAIKQLEKALALQPNSSEVLARLVTLYDRTGRLVEAQKARNSLATHIIVADANPPKNER
jgi:Flp pilus assembly protein TadD